MGVPNWFGKMGKMGGGKIQSQKMRLMLHPLEERAVPDATITNPNPPGYTPYDSVGSGNGSGSGSNSGSGSGSGSESGSGTGSGSSGSGSGSGFISGSGSGSGSESESGSGSGSGSGTISGSGSGSGSSSESGSGSGSGSDTAPITVSPFVPPTANDSSAIPTPTPTVPTVPPPEPFSPYNLHSDPDNRFPSLSSSGLAERYFSLLAKASDLILEIHSLENEFADVQIRIAALTQALIPGWSATHAIGGGAASITLALQLLELEERSNELYDSIRNKKDQFSQTLDTAQNIYDTLQRLNNAEHSGDRWSDVSDCPICLFTPLGDIEIRHRSVWGGDG